MDIKAGLLLTRPGL